MLPPHVSLTAGTMSQDIQHLPVPFCLIWLKTLYRYEIIPGDVQMKLDRHKDKLLQG